MKIPRKNVFKKMFDIRRPGDLKADNRAETERKIPAAIRKVPSPRARQIFVENQSKPKKQKFYWKALILSLIVLIVFGGGFFAIAAFRSKLNLFKNVSKNLESSGISSRLKLPSGDELEINSFADIQNKILPVLKGNFGAYQGITEIAGVWMKFSADTEELKSVVSGSLDGEEGAGVLPALAKVRDDVFELKTASDKLDASGLDIKQMFSISPEDYLKLKYELNYWNKALATLVEWLQNDRRIVVFLQNSSEMRPTGGFWGSFLELDVTGGKLKLALRDVSEIDRTLNTKTVPPKPLQALVTNWRTADANWFPDFSDSASKAKYFLDSSGFYASSSLKTDAIVAVSPRAVSDILAATGPINVSSTKEAIASDNFLPAIQEEVQAGHDIGSKNAKRVLKEALPVMLAKLTALDSGSAQKLLGSALSWPANKDVMLWAESPALQDLFSARSADGSLFDIPQKFNGDYLSVFGANIGGGKSDYVMNQTISLESQLGLDGSVADHLEIARKDTASKKEDWWYRMTNLYYLRVYIPQTSSLEGASGGLKKTIFAPINYAKNGYSADTLVAAIESTAQSLPGFSWLTGFAESGKKVLATWVKTAPGETSKLTFDYNHRLFSEPADGTTYEFVMDKQPGVKTDYSISISAPVGFVWAENGTPVYEYAKSDIPGRLTINLTLKKS